jgi:hypothetical protein
MWRGPPSQSRCHRYLRHVMVAVHARHGDWHPLLIIGPECEVVLSAAFGHTTC